MNNASDKATETMATTILWRGEEWIDVRVIPAHGPNGALVEWHSRDTFTRTFTPAGHIPVTARIVSAKPTSGLVLARGMRAIVA